MIEDLELFHRSGAQVVRTAVCSIGGPISSAIFNGLGLYEFSRQELHKMDDSFGERIQAISAEEAEQIITRMLHKDLAYDHTGESSLGECESFAFRWLEEHEANEAAYFTNGNWLEFWTSEGGHWTPMTHATFDGGVVAVAARYSACVWFEAED